MGFDTVSRLVTDRYGEVHSFLSHIAASERAVPATEPETQLVHLFRGLFFVHLYGAWEYSITRSLIELYSMINSCNVEHRHLEHMFGSIALDRMFKSIADVASSKQWERRFDLLGCQIGSDIARVDDNIFMFDVQFLKVQVIERIFTALGVTEAPVPNRTYRGLIDEVAERRSAVAHGRESPADVGRRFRSEELRRRYDALSSTSFYIIGLFENFLAGKSFVGSAHRHLYS